MVNCADHAYTVWLMVNGLQDSMDSQLQFTMEFHKLANALPLAVDTAIRNNKKESDV